MADTKESMPAQPKTVELPAMSDRAMLEDLYRIARGTAEQVRIIRTDQDLLMGNVESLKVDVRELQRWKLDTEERAAKHSTGLTRESHVNAEQSAAIATLITDVSGLKETQATQLAILQRLDAVAANPMVRRVAYALGTAVLGYLAAKGWMVK